MKLTRRQLALTVALADAAAQQPAAGADDELQAARNRVRANGDTLAATAVPMAVEPAFQFKA